MKSSRCGTARRLPLTVAAGLVLVFAAAACDGNAAKPTASDPTGVVPPTATTPATGPPPPTPPTPVGPHRCHTADLTADLGQPDSGTGHTGVTLVFFGRPTPATGMAVIPGPSRLASIPIARFPLP